jgi:hypothetical protein
MTVFVTKPGTYGTLYRYIVTYTDRGDVACPEFTQGVWAYNLEHAEDKFFDGEDSEGWKILSIRRLHDTLSQHHAIRHAPRMT